MDLDAMKDALMGLEGAISHLRDAGEEGLACEAIQLMEKCLTRYAAEGGDRAIFDAAAFY